MRISTWGIRDRWWPFGNVSVGGRHIHHFVPGILLAFASGTAALLTDDDALEDRLAVPMGVGMGLTFDEAALLLDLRDVYWTREGLLSVQLSLGATAILSIAILTQRMLRRGERGRSRGPDRAAMIPRSRRFFGQPQRAAISFAVVAGDRHGRAAALVCLARAPGRIRRPGPLTRRRCRSLPQPTSRRRTSRPRNRCWGRCWSPSRR